MEVVGPERIPPAAGAGSVDHWVVAVKARSPSSQLQEESVVRWACCQAYRYFFFGGGGGGT
jgi:hypothetical protein